MNTKNDTPEFYLDATFTETASISDGTDFSMHNLIFTTLLMLLFFSSCTESIDNQEIPGVASSSTFEVDLEVREYPYGYIERTQGESSQNYEERIFLSSNNIAEDFESLFTNVQVIGLELQYFRTDPGDVIEIDLTRPSNSSIDVIMEAFVGDDFMFGTGEAVSKRPLRTGTFRMEFFPNGTREITIDASSGGVPVKGSWTGRLNKVRFGF